MADLSNSRIADTFKDLLQVSNSNEGVDSTLRTVSDGQGTDSALKLSDGAISVDNVKIDGNTISTTTGALTLTPTAGSALNLDDTNVTVDGGAVDITGDLDVDNVNINGNTITSTDTNGLLNLTANGTGKVTVPTGNEFNIVDAGGLYLAGTSVSSTAAELNILDGVTATFAELNILDGVTSTAAELNILDGVTSTAAELNILDGVTSTAAELNILDGVTSTAAELNILDGVTATAAELNYCDITTAGTAQASKALVTDASNFIAGIAKLSVDNLQLDGNTLSNTSSGMTIASSTNGDIVITPDGTGDVVLDGLNWPQADGTANYVLKTDGAAQLSWTAPGIANVVEDTTPQLGGHLDVNGKEIQSVSATDILIHSDNDVNIILGDAAGADDLNIKDSANAIVLTVTSDGNIPVFGGQIAFPATQNASADGNTLDDYEEGTFTPQVYDAATAGNAASGGTFTGVYTKIGNVVMLDIILSNVATVGMTAGNQVFIRALPFTTSGVIQRGSLVYWEGVASTTVLQARFENAQTYLRLQDATDVSFAIVSDITSGANFIQIHTYYLI